MIMLRKDLAKPAILSGIIITIFTFLCFMLVKIFWGDIFANYWYLSNLSGINIFSIPFEELLFAFALGFGGSCFYEFVYNLRISK